MGKPGVAAGVSDFHQFSESTRPWEGRIAYELAFCVAYPLKDRPETVTPRGLVTGRDGKLVIGFVLMKCATSR